MIVVVPSDNRNCGAANAVHLANRILSTAAKSAVVDRESEILMTASVGIASTEGDLERTSDDLLREADLALYRAKRAGRNRAEMELRHAGSPPFERPQTSRPVVQPEAVAC